MYPAIKVALPKCGMASVMSMDIRDGPSISGGVGALALFHYMSTSITSLLLEQLFRDTPLGYGIRVCIGDLVLDAGMYGLLWEIRFQTISKYIDKHRWIYAVLDYNHQHNISISA